MFRIRLQRLAVAVIAAALGLVAAAGPASAAAGYGDVDAAAYYAGAVQWMADEGITTGTAPGCFSPDASATRGEVAVFLHRLVGEPVGGAEPFVDVVGGAFYAEAVAWMAATGITTGTSPTTFSPDRLVTRGELATFLHRLAGSPVSGSETFIDVEASDFFAVPVAWMATSGITTGTSPTTFSPDRPVTRAEVAAFMYRYAGSPEVVVDGGGVCSLDELAPLLEAEQRSFELLNELRVSLGRDPLVRTMTMDSFARDWSMTMHDTGDFRHSAGPYGENIAWWSNGGAAPTTAGAVMHDLWVDSPGHYANMTGSGYTEVGIGFWSGPGGWYATHVFR